MKYIGIIFLMTLFIANVNLFSQKEKKIEFELSVGVARVNPEFIYLRSSGSDELLDRYARHYQAAYTSTGEPSETKQLIPFSFSANYRINKQLYIKAGVDYSFSGTNTSENESRVTWSDFYEQYDYQLTDKVSYLMPHIGIGYGKGSLGIYGAIGMGFARFTYTENLSYSESEPGYSYDSEETFELKGTAPGVIIGVKYRLPFLNKSPGKGIGVFIKLEAVLLKVNSFSGTKTTVASDSQGERLSQTEEGTLYQFQWDPFDNRGFDFWDIYETLPSDPTRRSFEEMGLNFSGIRLMIGVSF